jgi:RNA polymerase sigma-70 factor (ECF subfamily)
MKSSGLDIDKRMQRNDEELYRLMRQGDREAFAELYTRREPALYRYALHASGSATVAEEVANEVFVQLMAPSVKFDDARGSLESYLYGMTRNLVRVVRRKGPVEEAVDRPFHHDILGDLIHNEHTAALHDALRELPDRYRDVVILCDLEEKNYEDVARLIGCPIGTVRSRLHRARATLAAKLRWMNQTADACAPGTRTQGAYSR